jgi:putative endonuclease
MDHLEAGRKAEDVAAEFLNANGLRILLRNYRRRLGELDVVAQQGNVLVIAEVRTRATDQYGGAAASIGLRKRARIVRAAQQLLQENRDWAQLPVRFDVVIVSDIEAQQPKVEWIKHAFIAGQ